MFFRSCLNFCKVIVTVSVVVVFLTPALGDDPDPKPTDSIQFTKPPQGFNNQPAQTNKQPQLLPSDPTPQPKPIDPMHLQQIQQQLQNQSKHLLVNPPNQHGLQLPFIQAKLEQMEQQLAKAREQLLLAHQELEMRESDQSQLKNGTLRTYSLKHIDPGFLREAIQVLPYADQLRLMQDHKNKTLLIYSTDEVAEQVEHLIEKLDIAPGSEQNKSLMLRIFWLADGIGEAGIENQLPKSVIHAVSKLGLKNPQLVAQSATSIVAQQGQSGNFELQFPAIAAGQSLHCESHGGLSLSPQPQLDLKVRVRSQANDIELQGTLSAPIGHYMVLGTTNYTFFNKSVEEEVSEFGEKVSEEVEITPSASRFAFVVQVVEAQSFAPEE